MKTIALVSGSRSTARALSLQLEEYIHGAATIRAFWVNGGIDGPVEADLVLLSSDLVLADMERLGLLPSGTLPIVASRTVDCDALEQVVALEPGSKALFVNDTPQTVRECIESMRDLGLDFIDWAGWHPGMPAPDPSWQIAVVAGERELVPGGVATVIDIGVRILDFGTIAEILRRLGMPGSDIGRFSRRYLARIVSLARRLARSNEEARRLSGHLGAVIDSLGHGVLVFDSGDRISVCNEELRSLLRLRGPAGVGSRLSAIIRYKELLAFLDCRCGEDERIFTLPAGKVSVRRFDLGEGGHTVAVFRSEGDGQAESARMGREYRRRGHVAKWNMDDIVGESECLRRAKRIAARLASTDLSILVNGESGTGKELFASAIHAASSRSSGPFLAVDLGALSDDLIESELFGYEEGAFTGARKGGKAGLFELADGGTLFLDEIGNISSKVQTRLLRVLQEKEVMRVGGSDILRVDVRIIAASKEDLLGKARSGSFREDLFFRLRMGWLHIPPLRDRARDIPLLVGRFLALEGVEALPVDPGVLDALTTREWPGNVRELRNTLTYMLAIREGPGLSLADLPDPGYFGGSGPRDSLVRDRVYDSPTAQAERTGMTDRSAGTERAELGDMERFVLAAIARIEAEGGHAGRTRVADLAARRGLALGPGSARAVMERLAARGLLESSRGRGGTRLSVAGRRLAGHL